MYVCVCVCESACEVVQATNQWKTIHPQTYAVGNSVYDLHKIFLYSQSEVKLSL